MRILGKAILDVTPRDIQALVAEGVREGQQLDYKQELPGLNDTARRDFIKDVCALANRDGGALLYGIREKVENGAKTGLPEAIVGVATNSAADAVSRLAQMIRANTDPALTTCVVRELVFSDGAVVVLVGVPRSVLAPHSGTVTKGTYWRRAGDQNYAVESRELRQMFFQGEEWRSQAEAFRRDRVARVRRRELIPNLDTRGSFFLHALPLGRLHETLDIVRHRSVIHANSSSRGLNWRCRANLEGVLAWQPGETDCKTYVQWFRCGGAEFYTSQCHHERKDSGVLDLDPRVVVRAIESARSFVGFMTHDLNVEFPIVLQMSLYDLAGGGIRVDPNTRVEHRLDEQANEFHADEILLPALLLDHSDVDVKEEVAKGLDWIWQAAGFDDCYVRRFREYPSI